MAIMKISASFLHEPSHPSVRPSIHHSILPDPLPAQVFSMQWTLWLLYTAWQ